MIDRNGERLNYKTGGGVMLCENGDDMGNVKENSKVVF